MTTSEYKFLVLSDLYRLTGSIGTSTLVRHILMGGTFRYIFWMRTCQYCVDRAVLKHTLFPLGRFLLSRMMFKYGIDIPYNTQIGSGFYIGHFGGIVISDRSTIGKNCNVSHGVTLGKANRGKNKGYPALGDNVYLGPGAKVIGAVKIGNNVAIGANCVVTQDIPDNSVVVGIPGRVISQEGSTGYVNGTDYEEMITNRGRRA